MITLCSTDDRYADDVHYMGGCLLASDMLWWASIMFVYNAQSTRPAFFVGERWRAMWLERLEKTPPHVEAWLTHQRRDAFWQHGSVAKLRGHHVSGLRRGRLDGRLHKCDSPLIGKFARPQVGRHRALAHEYPEVAVTGPQIGFLQECLRWWDHWLKGADTGIMQEPLLRAWLPEAVPPQNWYDYRAGRWVAEEVWPAPGIEQKVYQLSVVSEQSLMSTDNCSLTTDDLEIHSVQTHGLHAGVWCPFGQPGDLASDQRYEDCLASCFTSAPLGERMEILGFPAVTLTLSADKPTPWSLYACATWRRMGRLHWSVGAC